MSKTKKGITVKELLTYLPLDIIEQIGAETQVDKSVKKLFGKDMFYLMLLSVLDSERASLRIMEDLYKDKKFQLLAKVEHGSRTSFTSISDRLMNINADFFEELFKATYLNLSKEFSGTQIKKHSIIRFDSTSISASAKLLSLGMSNGRPTAKTGKHSIKQLKITIGFDGLLTPVATVFTEQKYLAEDLALGETISSYATAENSIVTFDRGLKKRITFAEFSKTNKLFVTRINPTKSFHIISEFSEEKLVNSDLLEFENDQWVYLYHRNKIKLKVPFRLIRTKNKESGKELWFLTNIEHMDANSITDVYKSRWDIEVFFRFLKQELNLKHFISYKLNGAKVWLYMILIASMLIMIYKKNNNISSYKRAKIKFIQAIDIEITRLIVEICGGNPNASTYLNST